MVKHRIYSVEFKRQVVQDYLSGETLHGLAKRHDISRNLIRIWIAKHEAGARLCRVPAVRLPTHNSPAARGRDHRQSQVGHAAYEGAWPYRAAAAALRGHHRQRS